jgi:hypothetical protein
MRENELTSIAVQFLKQNKATQGTGATKVASKLSPDAEAKMHKEESSKQAVQ